MKNSAEMGENSAASRPRLATRSAHTSTPRAFSTCSDTCGVPKTMCVHTMQQRGVTCREALRKAYCPADLLIQGNAFKIEDVHWCMHDAYKNTYCEKH